MCGADDEPNSKMEKVCVCVWERAVGLKMTTTFQREMEAI